MPGREKQRLFQKPSNLCSWYIGKSCVIWTLLPARDIEKSYLAFIASRVQVSLGRSFQKKRLVQLTYRYTHALCSCICNDCLKGIRICLLPFTIRLTSTIGRSMGYCGKKKELFGIQWIWVELQPQHLSAICVDIFFFLFKKVFVSFDRKHLYLFLN